MADALLTLCILRDGSCGTLGFSLGQLIKFLKFSKNKKTLLKTYQNTLIKECEIAYGLSSSILIPFLGPV